MVLSAFAPNGRSAPAVLLRESYREGRKAKKRTLANLGQLPPALIDGLRVLLQGGGALGAYHIGAYQALAEYGLHPDWVAGISISAINAAVIAGTGKANEESLVEAIDYALLLAKGRG